MKLIDKSALVAEIERRIKEREEEEKKGWAYSRVKIVECEHILSFIDTLEVKEVDLEKELDSLIIPELKKYKALPSLMDVARHFFELGMRVNNPITAADRGTAEEIIINLKRIEKDYHIDLTKEMEWLRNKVKTGE